MALKSSTALIVSLLLVCSVAQAAQVAGIGHKYANEHHPHYDHYAAANGPHSYGHHTHDYDQHQPCGGQGSTCAKRWPVEDENSLHTQLGITVGFDTAAYVGNDFAFDDRSCPPIETGGEQKGSQYESFATVFYAYEPQVSGAININTCDTTGDTVLLVLTEQTCFNYNPPGVFGTCTPWLAQNDDSDDCAGTGSSLYMQVTAGQTYIIALGNYDDVAAGAASAGVLEIKEISQEELRRRSLTRRQAKAPKAKKPQAPKVRGVKA